MHRDLGLNRLVSLLSSMPDCDVRYDVDPHALLWVLRQLCPVPYIFTTTVSYVPGGTEQQNNQESGAERG